MTASVYADAVARWTGADRIAFSSERRRLTFGHVHYVGRTRP